MNDEETLADLRRQLQGTGWSVGVQRRPDGQWQWIAWPGPAGRSNPAYVAARMKAGTQVTPTRLDAFQAAVDEAVWQSMTAEL